MEPSQAAVDPADPAIRALAEADDTRSARREPTVSLRPDRTIDDRRAEAAGIRKLSGKHLTLYTDLPSSPAIDELPRVFDLALPQWCEYFELGAADFGDWRMNGFVMKEKARFEASGLLPPEIPDFLNGFTRGNEFWMNHQTSEYYVRHLMLHEGTHGFMFTVLGGCGPPWYMEGLAELLGTHHWDGSTLRMNYFPKSAAEVPRLGRIEIVRDDFSERQAKSLPAVLEYGPRAHLDNRPYGWCWAAAAFLDGHPRYRELFRSSEGFIHEPNFNEQFLQHMGPVWQAATEEWQVFVANIDYGYDFERTAIDFRPGRGINGTESVKVAADRGWQNTGLQLQTGKTYRLKAEGRFQLAQQPKTWWSEAGGVSIRYRQGKPLGVLQAVVRPPGPASGASAFLKPIVVGLEHSLKVEQGGTLYLQINDSPGELHDNAGSLQVSVEEVPEGAN